MSVPPGADRRWQVLARALLGLAALSAVFSVWALYQWVPQAGSSGSSLHTLGISKSIRVILYALLWFGFTALALGGWKAVVLAWGRPSGATSAALWLTLFALFVIGLPVYVAINVGTPSL